MSNYRKREDCPPSSLLLMFQRGQISKKDRSKVSQHLDVCEFCLAEVEFYTHYPQSDEWIEPDPIPLPLYELALAMLRRDREGPAWLDRLLNSPKDN